MAYEAQDLLINSLKIGEPVSKAFQTVKKFIQDRNPNVTMGNNFGFGIGYLFKEEALAISASNQTLVQAGMTFHVRIALSNVHKEASRSIVAIGDTVVIPEEGTATVITNEIQKKYNEISYSLEDSDVEDKPAKKAVTAPSKGQKRAAPAKKQG